MSVGMKKVLVVDDEPNVRLMMRTTLEGSGYAVDEAADGPEALDRLRSAPADLVLLDLKMPGPSGLDVLRTLRESGDDVPVVFVTAYGSIADAVAAMRLGAIDFLTKPVTPASIRRVTDEVTSRHVETAPRDVEPQPLPPAGPAVVVVGPPAVDLSGAKRALNRRQFTRAEQLLQEALDVDPGAPETRTLLGVLQESLGQDHAAYHSYRAALTVDPDYAPALDNLRRYCGRFGLDFHSASINPAADRPGRGD